MKKAIIGIILNGLALFATTELVESIVHSGTWKLFLVGGIVIGLLNYFVKPLVKLLSFPLILITGGLFLVVINVFILWFTAFVVEILAIENVVLIFEDTSTYIISAIVFGIINWAEHLIIKNR